MKKSVVNEEGLFFIPLGGSEQFGMNLNIYIYDGEMLAIDCGLGFADERYPGIDLLLPDPSYIEENIDCLKGFVITHAHEDHIGAIAYLWERMQVPIYASPFTAAILYKKMEERDLRRVPVEIIAPGTSTKIGSFSVHFEPVSHSVPDTCSIVIKTKYGNVLHSGDWNLDPKPVVGKPTNGDFFKSIGEEGLLAYVGDSTNAEVDGYSGSESDVQKGLEAEFKKCGGRIVVTSFSSNIGRVKSIAKAAQACGRSVAVIGRSLHRMIGCAFEQGLLDGVTDFVDESDIELIPDEQIVVIVTGSQGEYRAALAKIARGEMKLFSTRPGDTVIFSARAIPGNEVAINHIKNNLSAGGVRVISPRDTDNIIHVSGHPCREEIAQMLGWIKPQIVVPVHGERAQLDAHAKFAESCQVSQTLVPNNGSVIKLAPGKAEIIDHIETGILAVEQKRIINAEHASIAERRKLQYTGAVHVTVVIDGRGELMSEPKLDILGLLDSSNEEEQSLHEQIHNEILDLIEELSWEDRLDDHLVSEEVRIGIRRYCQHMLGIKPKTTVHLVRL